MTAPLDPPDPARAPTGALALDTYRLTRRFGAFTALDDVTLTVRPGTVHALLGENGAGKSTLVKCVVGYQLPSAGSVLIDGREQAITSPTVARALGIGMVYQHFTVVPGMTVAENLLLARGTLPAWIDWKAVKRELSAFLETTPFRLDLDATPADLSAGEKQKLEILKQLYLRPRLLILDEPTSVLTPQEADEVLGALRERAHAGDCSIVMITHKFREVIAYADDVSVLRRGRLIHTGAVADTTPQKLAEAMVGGGASDELAAEVAAEIREELAHDMSPQTSAAGSPVPSGPARLQIRGLKVMGDRGEPSVQDFDLEAHAGEIVGVAGVSGNGQRELMEALVGQRPRAAGTVTVSGEAYAARRAQNRRLKVRSLPEEPLRNACVGHLSVAQNMALRSFDAPEYARGGWVRWGRLRARARAWIAEYGVKTRGEDAPIRTLSGGNVQRAVLARELGELADLLLVANPVFGLDFAAVAEIHTRLRAARDGGTAVLLVSEDLDELLALSDRIVVMSEGRIVFGCAAADADRHTLGAHMGGHAAGHGTEHPEAT
ncbi:ABC transporter ATP-binding protein [Sphaerotilus mobilis]|uniref:Nucleoside ABC transporter ATP-binding protein n=1 Tax=Sphaerotilus mobilis TaxID=47994 RepID=A0A4Q7LEE1_9BURK|nr:ABC transporter ATP-binding protein [Sphaerotilus mobilis]RZS52372.1 nucleoside ABC transporter ATP-binding protein [Sphaerotilus mobilis]